MVELKLKVSQKLTFVLYKKYFILKLNTAEIEMFPFSQTVKWIRMNNDSAIRKKI